MRIGGTVASRDFRNSDRVVARIPTVDANVPSIAGGSRDDDVVGGGSGEIDIVILVASRVAATANINIAIGGGRLARGLNDMNLDRVGSQSAKVIVIPSVVTDEARNRLAEGDIGEKGFAILTRITSSASATIVRTAAVVRTMIRAFGGRSRTPDISAKSESAPIEAINSNIVDSSENLGDIDGGRKASSNVGEISGKHGGTRTETNIEIAVVRSRSLSESEAERIHGSGTLEIIIFPLIGVDRARNGTAIDESGLCDRTIRARVASETATNTARASTVSGTIVGTSAAERDGNGVSAFGVAMHACIHGAASGRSQSQSDVRTSGNVAQVEGAASGKIAHFEV